MTKKEIIYGQSYQTITLKVTEWEQLQTLVQMNNCHYGNKDDYEKREENILKQLNKVSRYEMA